jgi:hypothetical protein
MQLQQLWLARGDAAEPEMQLAKAALHVPHQSLAFRRQADGAAFALEQHGAEIPFQPANGMADRTRRQP